MAGGGGGRCTHSALARYRAGDCGARPFRAWRGPATAPAGRAGAAAGGGRCSPRPAAPITVVFERCEAAEPHSYTNALPLLNTASQSNSVSCAGSAASRPTTMEEPHDEGAGSRADGGGVQQTMIRPGAAAVVEYARLPRRQMLYASIFVLLQLLPSLDGRIVTVMSEPTSDPSCFFGHACVHVVPYSPAVYTADGDVSAGVLLTTARGCGRQRACRCARCYQTSQPGSRRSGSRVLRCGRATASSSATGDLGGRLPPSQPVSQTTFSPSHRCPGAQQNDDVEGDEEAAVEEEEEEEEAAAGGGGNDEGGAGGAGDEVLDALKPRCWRLPK